MDLTSTKTRAEVDHFFRLAFSVDCVVFGFDGLDLKILLINRGAEPYKGEWALPGDLVNLDEDIDDAAGRILEQLTGLRDVYLEQVHTFGQVDRHPLGRVVTVAYYSLVKISDYHLHASSFARQASWLPVHESKSLAFDHQAILDACRKRLQQKVRVQPIGFELLPRKFTLTALHLLYDAVLDTSLDKRNFRKKILSMNLLIDLNEYQTGVAHRPAKLYKFDQEKYKEFIAKGYNFEL